MEAEPIDYTLEYRKSGAGDQKPFTVTRQNDCVELVVPRTGYYLPIPKFLEHADIAGLILIPLWMIGYSIADAIFKYEVPPWAVFRISAAQLQMTIISDNGQKQEWEYPREKVVEFRKNRYEAGIWLRVEGVTMESHLTELDDDVVRNLCAEFWKISKEYDVSPNPDDEVGKAGHG